MDAKTDVIDVGTRIERVAGELGLTMTAEFIPWSRSRNKSEKQPSLNWRVTISRKGRAVVTTDYMAGSGQAPSYKPLDRTVVRAEVVEWECEHGLRGHWADGLNCVIKAAGAKPITPKLADVISSLVLDSDVIEHPDFELWAAEFGYDIDSRKAEAIYRACLDIALKLRAGIGDEGVAKLREACQDY